MLQTRLAALRARVPELLITHHAPTEPGPVVSPAADAGLLELAEEATHARDGVAHDACEHLHGDGLGPDAQMAVRFALMHQTDHFDPESSRGQ